MTQNLEQQQIIVIISGGVAAYKSAELVRLLVQAGAKVRVVMTASACEFITPLTLQALSGHVVHTELLDSELEAGMGHIELARWAEKIVIAPATANIIARLASGLADDLATTLCLATSAPIYIAPAMNQAMWQNMATQTNIQVLRDRKMIILGPGYGVQACGDTGPGRMLEPNNILQQLQTIDVTLLTGLSILINAGPTWEAIDPVRFIANRSSGKMGYALAEAAAQLGAKVTLISGPVCLAPPHDVTVHFVETAAVMLECVLAHIDRQDIFIATAAVADYRVQQPAQQKIKKQAAEITLVLEKNPDILATVSARNDPPFLVGFAAETENVAEYAQTKLMEKRLDMIAANPVSENLGFAKDENTLTLYWRDGCKALGTAPKNMLAYQLLRVMMEQFNEKYTSQDT